MLSKPMQSDLILHLSLSLSLSLTPVNEPQDAVNILEMACQEEGYNDLLVCMSDYYNDGQMTPDLNLQSP